MTTITAQDVADLERIEAEIEEDLPEFKKRGLRLGENFRIVRDRELYKKDYRTFEAYLELRWDISRQYAYRLINGDKIVKSLPKSLSPRVRTERVARALGAVPPEQQADVLEHAVSTGDPITSSAIEASATVIANSLSPTGRQTETETVVLDDTGYQIPADLLPIWNRSHEPRPMLQKISDVRSFIRHLMEEGAEGRSDVLYRECGTQAILSELDKAFYDLKRAIPFAVCPFCQGENCKACMTCKGRGLISHHMWNATVPSNMKAVRANFCAPVKPVEEEE